MEHNIDVMGSKQHQIALITGSSSGIGFETSIRSSTSSNIIRGHCPN